jgi:MFS family permease
MARQAAGRPAGVVRREHDFRWFWAGQTVSVVGTQVTAVALPLAAALTLRAGPGAVGAIAAATYLPNVVLPLLAGHWLEHRSRRPPMVWADIVRAAALALVPVAYAGGFLSLGLLVGVAFVVGAASVVFDIASFAYVPGLVVEEDLTAANRAMQGSATAAQAGGPGVAGVLVQAFGPAVAVLVDSVSYLASVLGITRARRPEPPPAAVPATRTAFLDGVRQLLGNPFLRALAAHAATYNAFSQVLMVNLVVWLVRDRQVTVGVYGVALTAAGAGAFVGAMSVLRVIRRSGYGRTYTMALVLFTGVPLVLAALPLRGDPLGLVVGAVMAVSGIGLGAANVLSTTLRQTAVPKATLARSIGSYRLLIFGIIPLGSGLGGLVGENFGSRVGVALGTAGMALSAAPIVLGRTRRLRDPKDALAAEVPAMPAAPANLIPD